MNTDTGWWDFKGKNTLALFEKEGTNTAPLTLNR